MSVDPATLAVISLATSAVGTGAQVVGQIQQGKAAQAQANFKSQVARNNSIIAGHKAEDARVRGEIAAQQEFVKNAQLRSKQRVVLAGNNVTVGQDAAAQLSQDTADVGTRDALTVQSNAEREALGFAAQASNFEADARLQSLAAANSGQSLQAGASLLAGTASVAAKWSSFKTNKVLP